MGVVVEKQEQQVEKRKPWREMTDEEFIEKVQEGGTGKFCDFDPETRHCSFCEEMARRLLKWKEEN